MQHLMKVKVKLLRSGISISNDVMRLYINLGDVVMMKEEEKNRGHWKISIVNDLYIGRDNIIPVAQLRIGKKLIDRPIQLLYLLELHFEGIITTNGDQKKNELNPSATGFHPKQIATEIAKWRLKDIAIEDDDGGI